VVGVDASRRSLRAAVMAWRIAGTTERRLHLVYATPEIPTASFIPDVWRGARAGGFRVADPRARGKVVRALRTVLPRTVADSLEARPGQPPTVVAAAAQRVGAGLVVVGGGRRSGARTAQYLVRRGRWSVMVVRSTPPIRSILAAVHDSAGSQPALRAGREYARIFSASLRVVHVVEVRNDPAMRGLGRLERSQEALSRFLDRQGGVRGSVRRAATASAGIVQAAAKWRAGLVIVSARRLGHVDRLLLGSTTERLLDDLPTSLLVVRTSRR
jgi:nucleotide-binding universal stress UspA family protein